MLQLIILTTLLATAFTQGINHIQKHKGLIPETLAGFANSARVTSFGENSNNTRYITSNENQSNKVTHHQQSRPIHQSNEHNVRAYDLISNGVIPQAQGTLNLFDSSPNEKAVQGLFANLFPPNPTTEKKKPAYSYSLDKNGYQVIHRLPALLKKLLELIPKSILYYTEKIG